jgi:peptide/nickel transport system permease protein
VTAQIVRRVGILFLQVLGVMTVTFFLIRLAPGNPAYALLGSYATPETIKAIDQRLGLLQPLPIQYFDYLRTIFLHGDLGTSLTTNNPVLNDLIERVPATLVLITVSLFFAASIALILAAVVAARPRGIVAQAVRGYGFFAGAAPDFWIALALIFLVYYKLGLVPDPIGQVDPLVTPPVRTHVAVIDAALAGDGAALSNSLEHMILPVVTLVIVYVGPILRLTTNATTAGLDQNFTQFARALGLKPRRVVSYAIRNALPVFVTIVGTTYGFLLGGAVLIETIFSWNGVGQYAVSAVTSSDYAALQGFVIAAGIFTALVYAAVDLAYLVVNPRARRS